MRPGATAARLGPCSGQWVRRRRARGRRPRGRLRRGRRGPERRLGRRRLRLRLELDRVRARRGRVGAGGRGQRRRRRRRPQERDRGARRRPARARAAGGRRAGPGPIEELLDQLASGVRTIENAVEDASGAEALAALTTIGATISTMSEAVSSALDELQEADTGETLRTRSRSRTPARSSRTSRARERPVIVGYDGSETPPSRRSPARSRRRPPPARRSWSSASRRCRSIRRAPMNYGTYTDTPKSVPLHEPPELEQILGAARERSTRPAFGATTSGRRATSRPRSSARRRIAARPRSSSARATTAASGAGSARTSRRRSSAPPTVA